MSRKRRVKKATPTKRPLRAWLVMVVVGAVVGGVIGLFVLDNSSTVMQPATATPAPTQAHQPSAEPEDPFAGLPGLEELRSKFLALAVEGHPDPRISQGFREEVLAARFYLSFTVGLGNGMCFFNVGQTTSGKQMPNLMVNVERLMTAATEHDRWEWRSIVLHEYTHYQQWLKAPSDRRGMFDMNRSARTLNAEECIFIWWGEYEAYGVGCRFLMERDPQNPGLSRQCADVDTDNKKFSAWVLTAMSHTDGAAKCLAVWAKEASTIQ